ncbi:DUF3768 domain-containing protein [Minwuia sp.]|uniref:DUF3768 domain-containing protein n=1 Tax=Minwuia sp. TaxID=2493630 RepID=UPI003A90B7B3
MTDHEPANPETGDTTDDADRTARIRNLNDRFRTLGSGRGRILITPGIQALGIAAGVEILKRVRTFDDFSEDNDPYGEHDFGSFDHAGETIFWKIDHYGLTLDTGSEDPADETVTTRVLTILLASEY